MHRDAARLHQVHPAKLATDGLSGAAALVLLWQRQYLAGALLLLVPPLVATLLLLRFARLDALAPTRLGRAVVAHMAPPMQGARLAGMLVAAVGAVLHQPWEIALGLVIVAAGWAPALVHAARGAQ